MHAADTSDISSWHAHVYFDADSRDAAWDLRRLVSERFAGELAGGALMLGRFHERTVGPHPCWSFQLGFGRALLAPMLEWLALNHGALDVFLHPNTGDELRDHRDSAVWIGRSHELVLTVFSG
ncbi:DOPA 4,5-dioxygenase family protein [Caballeronia sp. Lep1P3]|uniref:DOPA 4,5-dioxygenase family protein n=1 Tax=Caballeronia sp. Lep1P3 TaxID=2878150 RepID=UPI001FD3E4C3|nr:DOPA 4,5-dioxygenase family protein [Caballeronia sp. Lep1P3]